MKVITASLLLLAAATLIAAQNHDYRLHGMDLIRLLANKPGIIRANSPWNPPSHNTLESNEDTNFRDNQDNDEDGSSNFDNGEMSGESEKRSAVATALNGSRRRRQPTPALGKVVTPYVGVGVLNDMDNFFDFLRDNLENLASMSPQQRMNLFQDQPHVLQVPSTGSSGGGSGMRRLHALRPLRPTGNLRSYNRRSFVESDGYPAANHHDPGLLWTGLGRR